MKVFVDASVRGKRRGKIDEDENESFGRQGEMTGKSLRALHILRYLAL